MIARREFLWRMGSAAAVATLGVPGAPRLATAFAGKGREDGWRLSEDFLASLQDRLAAADVPGIAIGIGARDGPGSIFTAGQLAGPGSGAVTADTVFMAASLSKPVLATLALAMHEEGRLDLDRPIATYLSDDLPTGEGAEGVTGRHCLAHASGLPNWRFAAEPLTVDFRPGARWRYSGEGYVLVQRVLERISGHGIERMARERIFGPLSMDSTSYLASPPLEARTAPPFIPPDERFADYAALLSWKERAVVRHALDSGRDPADLRQSELRRIDGEIAELAAELAGREFPETAPVPNFIVPNAAGSLRTTAADYTRFLQHWLRSRRLRTAAFEEPIVRDDRLAWGIGWGLESDAGGPDAAFWHWGETMGVRTLAYADPVRDGTFVVLTNGGGGMEIATAAFEDATGGRSPILDAL